MERMLIVVFNEERRAYEGKAALRQLELEQSITIFGQAVIARRADGTTTIQQYDDPAPLGTAGAMAVGSLVSLLGGPVGLADGSLSGMALGVVADFDNARVAEDFIEEGLRLFTPNKVALVAEIDEDWTTPLDTRMEGLGGTVLRRALWEAEDTIGERQIAAMKSDLDQMKEEIAQTAGARRDHLQARIAHLEQTIHRKQQKAVERWNGFQARQQAKRKILERKAVAARRAIKDLAQTTVA